MRGLTVRQLQTLEVIKDSIHERGYPPTLREIGAHMGIRSTNGVSDHLRVLERKGVITLSSGLSRGIQLVEASDLDKIDAARSAVVQAADDLIDSLVQLEDEDEDEYVSKLRVALAELHAVDDAFAVRGGT